MSILLFWWSVILSRHKALIDVFVCAYDEDDDDDD